MQKFMGKDESKTGGVSLKASFSEEDLRTFRNRSPHYSSQENENLHLERADAISRNFSSSTDYAQSRVLNEDSCLSLPRFHHSHFKVKGDKVDPKLNMIQEEETKTVREHISPVGLDASEEFGADEFTGFSPRTDQSHVK
jgi:hypothetical protein